MAILAGIKWPLTVFLIRVFLMTSDVEHLFVFLLIIHVSLVQCLYKSLSLFNFSSYYSRGILIGVSQLEVGEMGAVARAEKREGKREEEAINFELCSEPLLEPESPHP